MFVTPQKNLNSSTSDLFIVQASENKKKESKSAIKSLCAKLHCLITDYSSKYDLFSVLVKELINSDASCQRVFGEFVVVFTSDCFRGLSKTFYYTINAYIFMFKKRNLY